jgi:Domain of unknown function (DUF3854)
MPSGVKMDLDVPPGARDRLKDPNAPLWVTEGIPKADAAVSAGLCCVALLGVWNFRGTNDLGGKVALAAWENIALNDRLTYLAFDSDVMLKPEVHAALQRLGALLTTRGARVAYVYLRTRDDGGKVGLDDFLAAGGTVDDLTQRATTELRECNDTAAAPTPSKAPATVQPQPVAAPAIARDQRILDRFKRDVRSLGVVGEDATACNLYLVATTRLFGGEGMFSKPGSATVKGHSASGKSFTTETVMRFFPDSEYVAFTAMSERALIYSQDPSGSDRTDRLDPERARVLARQGWEAGRPAAEVARRIRRDASLVRRWYRSRHRRDRSMNPNREKLSRLPRTGSRDSTCSARSRSVRPELSGAWRRSGVAGMH